MFITHNYYNLHDYLYCLVSEIFQQSFLSSIDFMFEQIILSSKI